MIQLRPLGEGDIVAHMAGEDAEVVKWLTGVAGTWDSTHQHFEMLAANAARGVGKRGFGIWLNGELAGYIDFDPDGTGTAARSGDMRSWLARCGQAGRLT